MTIAVCVKVHDGVVLAADSASTLYGRDPKTGKEEIIKVWTNASKVFNLQKGLPIGAAAWGAGAIGRASMSTIMKDLRRCFVGQDPDHNGWQIDPQDYSIEKVAARVREYLYEELYQTEYKDNVEKKAPLGIFIAGYSTTAGRRAPLAEVYRVEVDKDGHCEATPSCVRGESDCGIDAGGFDEAVLRLRDGFSPELRERLISKLKVTLSGSSPSTAGTPGQPEQEVEMPDLKDVFDALRGELQMAHPDTIAPMPIRDAIDLANFLATTSAGFSRFSVGQEVVGGTIETAVITKHEKFKWVSRKYFFERALNPDSDELGEVSPYPAGGAQTAAPAEGAAPAPGGQGQQPADRDTEPAP